MEGRCIWEYFFVLGIVSGAIIPLQAITGELIFEWAIFEVGLIFGAFSILMVFSEIFLFDRDIMKMERRKIQKTEELLEKYEADSEGDNE